FPPMGRRRKRLTASDFIQLQGKTNLADAKARIAERDEWLAADTRTPAQVWLGDPPPGRSALATQNLPAATALGAARIVVNHAHGFPLCLCQHNPLAFVRAVRHKAKHFNPMSILVAACLAHVITPTVQGLGAVAGDPTSSDRSGFAGLAATVSTARPLP